MPTQAEFDTYTLLLVEDGRIRGRDTITQLVAIGAAESGLNNLAIGNNAANGTDPSSPAYLYAGWGWLQLNGYWGRRNEEVNGVPWDHIAIRSDPAHTIDLLVDTPGYIAFQGVDRTYMRYDRWNVWPNKSDQSLAQAEASYDALYGGV